MINWYNLDVLAWEWIVGLLTTGDIYCLVLAFPVLFELLPDLEKRCEEFENETSPCWFCFRRFKDIRLLHIHLVDHPKPTKVSNYFPQFCLKDPTNKFFRCSLCESDRWRIFEKKWYLKRHLKLKHMVYWCRGCSTRIIGLTSFRSHKHEVKSLNKLSFCSVCGRKFRNRQECQKHVGCHFKKVSSWGWGLNNVCS